MGGLPIGRRGDEVFDFHLLELAGAEDEVAGVDFVTERLTDLGDAERQLHAAGIDHVLKVNEDTLRRFRAKVSRCGSVLHGADIRLEHHVERAGRRQGARLTGGGRWDEGMLLGLRLGIVLERKRLEGALLGQLALHLIGHLFGLGRHRLVFEYGNITDGLARHADGSEEQLVGTVAHLRLPTIDQRVGEVFDVA